MIDARNVYRKVTRKIYDFSPEQLANLTAIVWLYRGAEGALPATDAGLLLQVCEESATIPAALESFEVTLKACRKQLTAFSEECSKVGLHSSRKEATSHRCARRMDRSGQGTRNRPSLTAQGA